jgi:cation transport ATPase
MACCAIAGYIVWKILSLHDRVNKLLAPSDGSELGDRASLPNLSINHYETETIGPYGNEKPSPAATRIANTPVSEGSYSTCVLSLTGITCGACVNQITSAVTNLPAVRACQISLVLSRAVIEYDKGKISPPDIISRIQDAGYDAFQQASQSHRNLQDTLSAVAAAEEMWNATSSQLYRDLRYSMLLSTGTVLWSASSRWLQYGLPSTLYTGFHVIAGFACIFVSRSIHLKAYDSLVNRSPRGVSALSSLAIVIAFLHSLVILATRASKDVGLAPTRRADAISSLVSMALISTVVLAGQTVKHSLSRRSLGHNSRLANMFPQTARVLVHGAENGPQGTETSVATSMLQNGDTAIVFAGDRLPADGVVISGEAEIDQSWLTGDDRLISASEGVCVSAGCLIVRGQITIRIEHCGLDTNLGRLVDLVSATDLQPASPRNSLDSSRFVDLILIFTSTTGVALFLRGLEWQACLHRVVSMLLCACPCALELSVPVSLISAAGTYIHGEIV